MALPLYLHDMKNNDFTNNGYELWDKVLSEDDIILLKREIANLDQSIPKYGIRFAEQLLPSLKGLAHSKKIITKVQSYLQGSPQLVRALVFDKSPDKNWFVPWHQDRTLAINKEFNSPGWKNWTVKRGVLHAEAPTEVLKNMITIRLHLDDATPENGAMKFIPGSHQSKLSGDDLSKKIEGDFLNCKRQAGDAFIMRPLLLHSSNKSQNDHPRRVIHLEYCAAQLPEGIHWATQEA